MHNSMYMQDKEVCSFLHTKNMTLEHIGSLRSAKKRYSCSSCNLVLSNRDKAPPGSANLIAMDSNKNGKLDSDDDPFASYYPGRAEHYHMCNS